MTPPISVIMTVYNGARHVADAVSSICQQTFTDFELVVVDDGSTDATPAILTQLAVADSRIKLFSRPHFGRAAALNYAWRQARGAAIANLDADDLALPTRLATQHAFMQAHPAVGVLGSACRVVDERKGSQRIMRHPSDDAALRTSLTRRSSFVHSAVMLSRAVLQQVGGYNARYHKSHDYDLFVRMARHCRLANLPDVLTVKRKHSAAHFSPHAYRWFQAKDHIAIRQRAWRTLDPSPANVPHVLAEPLLRWLYLLGKQRLRRR